MSLNVFYHVSTGYMGSGSKRVTNVKYIDIMLSSIKVSDFSVNRHKYSTNIHTRTVNR